MSGKISVISQTQCYGNFWLTRILTRIPESLMTVIRLIVVMDVVGHDEFRIVNIIPGEDQIPLLIQNLIEAQIILFYVTVSNKNFEVFLL